MTGVTSKSGAAAPAPGSEHGSGLLRVKPAAKAKAAKAKAAKAKAADAKARAKIPPVPKVKFEQSLIDMFCPEKAASEASGSTRGSEPPEVSATAAPSKPVKATPTKSHAAWKAAWLRSMPNVADPRSVEAGSIGTRATEASEMLESVALEIQNEGKHDYWFDIWKKTGGL